MNNQFDEMTKGLAQSVTRRGALKKFGVGLAGMALATLGLAPRAQGAKAGLHCNCHNTSTYGCERSYSVGSQAYYDCVSNCAGKCAKGGPY